MNHKFYNCAAAFSCSNAKWTRNRSGIWTIGARKMYLVMLACAFTAFYVNSQFVYEMKLTLCSRALCKVMWLSSLIVLNDIITISLLKCGITICLWTCIEWAFCKLTEQQMCLFPVSVSLADACLKLSILLRLEVDRNSWCWIIGWYSIMQNPTCPISVQKVMRQLWKFYYLQKYLICHLDGS